LCLCPVDLHVLATEVKRGGCNLIWEPQRFEGRVEVLTVLDIPGALLNRRCEAEREKQRCEEGESCDEGGVLYVLIILS